MRVVFALLAVLWIAIPLVAAAWLIFPIIAGVAAWCLIRLMKQQESSRFLRPALGLLLLGFVFWMLWIWRLTPGDTRYGDDVATRLFTRIGGPAQEAPLVPGELARERQQVANAIARERKKVTLISTALNLYTSADAVAVHREQKGLPDESGLRSSLTDLLEVLQPHAVNGGSQTPNLLMLPELRDLENRVRVSLDEIESLTAAEQSADSILAVRLSVPGRMASYRLDQLYGALTKTEAALRGTLKADVRAESDYRAQFDRAADQLTTEQVVTIGVSNQQAVGVDLCGFLFKPGDPKHQTSVQVREDSAALRPVTAEACRLNVRPETKQIRVIKTYVVSQASRPLVLAPWSRMREIRVQWLIPLVSAAVLNLRFADDPTVTWPLTIPVETAPGTAISNIGLPRYSFYFSEPSMRLNEGSDALVPEPGAPSISDLATDASIRVELLPNYLSNTVGQQWKHYLATQNAIAALVVAVVTSTLTAVVAARKDGKG